MLLVSFRFRSSLRGRGECLSEDARCEARFDALAIAGLSADSRAVAPGFLFVAVPGTKADGLAFVAQAVSAGAVAVMAERAPPALPAGVAFVQVGNVRRALALAAAKFHPRQPATIAAVTGTSGKTSVAAFTRQIWAALGHKPASIGTIGVVSPQAEIYGSLTTPDPVELHRTLDRLAREGVTHLAIEASSHGLDQHRLDGVRVGVASFTSTIMRRRRPIWRPSFCCSSASCGPAAPRSSWRTAPRPRSWPRRRAAAGSP